MLKNKKIPVISKIQAISKANKLKDSNFFSGKAIRLFN